MSLVSQKTGYQLKIYFLLLFSRLADMANTNIIMVLSEEDKILIKTCTFAKNVLLDN